ncbi:hypothetical protein TIFTF001_002517 [Ficus carica]|uniref:Cupin type-1 domain-containing protein n=1 Tax=Ficus carica TaxID=3494 RepID=A0AA87ZBV2_FICCA|nr:hypothetical protein TIFTF001_002517 [Ficus carica]
MFGVISAVNISDGIRGPYHIEFFTLKPNSLFLPVLLYADMEPAIGAYSSIRNLVRGFDKMTLKQAFKVPDEVIESITSATDGEAIVHAISTKIEKKDKKEKKEKKEKKKKSSIIMWEMEARFLKAFLGGKEESYNKKKKSELYNLFDEEPDFENCNGWSLTVNPKRAVDVLHGTNVGLFMVNLTKGSMMGPHWNPKATEIAIVLQGQGMVRVVCPSRPNKSKQECKNMRLRVKEGDVFSVPRFHPMAQISFNNDSLVFMGFTTTREENHPQFLAGKQSVLQTLDIDILALSFNVSNTTVRQLLAPQADSKILDCTSCAEEEERIMEEEIEKEKAEEEERKREKEKEERRKREEEEREREEEERKRREEEERKREEEEKRRQEEEERKRREEEEERKREEEEARKREEEEREREREEEERRQEEERQRQEEEEEREREREEEEARQREEERERERQQEEEEGGGGGGGEKKVQLEMWTV